MALAVAETAHRFSWTVAPGDSGRRRRGPNAVLFDRDGTLLQSVPHDADPALLSTVPGARDALDALRDAEVRLGVVVNRPDVRDGRANVADGVALDGDDGVDVVSMNREVERQLGRFDVWCLCPHGPAEECCCRTPLPGLVVDACSRLGVPPTRTVLVTDAGADVAAALVVGVHPILVPTGRTPSAEIASAPVVADTLGEAVAIALGVLV